MFNPYETAGLGLTVEDEIQHTHPDGQPHTLVIRDVIESQAEGVSFHAVDEMNQKRVFGREEMQAILATSNS